jgi:nucleoside 2-deoxyribosyltransferase
VAQLKILNHQIAERNRQAIESGDVVVAVLDGPDVDSGTASEIGFAFACGKTIFGYRGDIRLTGENQATLVNLQVQYWIEESGGRKGRLVRTVPDLLMALDALIKSS